MLRADISLRARQKQKNSNNSQQTAQKVGKKRQKFGQRIEFQPAQALAPLSVELPQQSVTSQSTFTFEVVTPLTYNQTFTTSRTDNTPQ